MSESSVYISSIPQPKGNTTLKATAQKTAQKPAVSVSSVTSDLSTLDIGVKKPRVQGVATVKNVLSGDTLLLVGASKGGVPAKEKRVILSGITAPKVGFGKTGVDEPFGYQAKEFLRSKVLGQIVHFTLQSDAPVNGREYADVSIQGKDLASLMVENGFAKVSLPKTKESDSKDKKTPIVDVSKLHPEKEALYKLQLVAEKKKLGMFSNADPNVRTITWEPDTVAIFNKYKNKPIPAVVDRVIDGSTFRVEIADPAGSLNHTMLTLNLAGVLAPRTPLPTKEGEKPSKPLPFALEAQQLSETRLNNRDVKVVLQGIDKVGNLYGTIQFSKGNIALRLLELGYGKYVPWTAALTSPEDQVSLKTAAGAVETVSKAEYDGVVTQIISGDAFVVRDNYGVEHRVALASVQAPRIRGNKFEPFAFEAREFLRKSLISKRVRVIVEYERDIKKESKKDEEDAVDSRQFVTVFKNKYNVAVELVNAGLGDVLSYSKDADRTVYYADLCQAEFAAKAAEKGKHSKKAAPPAVMDLTSVAFISKKTDDEAKKSAKSANKANSERVGLVFDKLQRSKAVSGVLEHVFSPTRIKVYVPVINSFISVGISGISAPAQAPKGEPRNPVVDAGINELKKHLQHDLLVEVLTLGRNDTFLANVLLKDSQENLGVTMLSKGFASVLGFSVENNSFKAKMIKAEADAKEGRLGMWVDYDEEKERLEAEKARQEAADSLGMGIYTKDGQQYINVVVTDVADPIHFYINCVDDKNVALIREKLASFNPDEVPIPEGFHPAKGSLVTAKFEDGSWYRARIEGSSVKSGTYSVQYIDFGNTDTLTIDSIRPLSDELSKIRPLARPCTLSGVKAPLPTSEHFEPGANALANMTGDQQFAARIDHTEYGGSQLLHLTLFHESDAVPINAHMLKQGWVRIHPRPVRKLDAIISNLMPYELEAKDNHYNIWEYGSYTSDLDDY